jgi:PAS domain S-box-containing protein
MMIESLLQSLTEAEIELRNFLGEDTDSKDNSMMVRLLEIHQAIRHWQEEESRRMKRLPAVVFELAADGTILYTNQAITALTGYSPDDLRGENWWGIFFAGERRHLIREFLRQIETGDVTGYEMELPDRDRRPVWLQLNTANWYGADGSLQRIVGLGIDITGRRRAEETLLEGKYTLERRVEQRTAQAARARDEAERRAEEAEQKNLELQQTIRSVRTGGRILDGPAAEVEAIINSIADALVIFNASGDIVRSNPAAGTLLAGIVPDPEKPGVGNLAHLETPEGAPFPFREKILEPVLQGGVIQGMRLVTRYEERVLCLSVSAAPIYKAVGSVLGAVATFADITELHQLQRQREINVHMISHDLRLPLTVIHGHAELLKMAFDARGDVAEVQIHVDAILQSSDRMNMMIEDMVDAARLEGGQLVLNREPVDMGDFIIELLNRACSAMDVDRFQLDIAMGLPNVLADPDRLERIVLNLLTNALKYSPPNKKIRLQVRPSECGVAMAVIDQGNGISPRDLPHIFECYYRSPGERRRDSVGLGLYITRMLVEAHGGRIYAESYPGRGSTFTFTLPVTCD